MAQLKATSKALAEAESNPEIAVGSKQKREEAEDSENPRAEKRARKSVERLKSSSLRTSGVKAESSPRAAPSPRPEAEVTSSQGGSAASSRRQSKGAAQDEKAPQIASSKRRASHGKADGQKPTAEGGGRSRDVPEEAVLKVFSPSASSSKVTSAKAAQVAADGMQIEQPPQQSEAGKKRPSRTASAEDVSLQKSTRKSVGGEADGDQQGKRPQKKAATGAAESSWSQDEARWCRPVKDEGMGGEWMVGRHVQVWHEGTSTWKVGTVRSFSSGTDALGEPGRLHEVEYADQASQLVVENFLKLRWKLDRKEDTASNPRTFKLHDLPDRDQIIAEAKPAPHLKKRLKARCRSPPISRASAGTEGQDDEEEDAGQSEVPAKAFGLAAAADQLKAKLDLVFDALDGVKVHVPCKGSRCDGELTVDDGLLRVLMGDDSGRSMSLQEFADLGKASAGAQQQLSPKQVIVISSNGDTLAAYETTVSGYGRQKIVDGTKVRMMFDDEDWFQGEVTAYEPLSGQYKVLFQDGEEVLARHALFEKDGFFLDNDRDCGLSFKRQLASPAPHKKAPAQIAGKASAPQRSSSAGKKNAAEGASKVAKENGADKAKPQVRVPSEDDGVLSGSPRVGSKTVGKSTPRAMTPRTGVVINSPVTSKAANCGADEEEQEPRSARRASSAAASKRKSIADEGDSESASGAKEGEMKTTPTKDGAGGKEKEGGGRQGRWKLECQKMLGRLMRQPVDPVALGLPDYNDIIKQPMDFGTVQDKLESGRYGGTREVLNDVALTLRNALVYNPEKDLVWKLAKSMKEIFLSLVNGSEILRAASFDVVMPDSQGDKKASSQPGSPRAVASPRPAQPPPAKEAATEAVKAEVKKEAGKQEALKPSASLPKSEQAAPARKEAEKQSEGAKVPRSSAGVGGVKGVGGGERVKQTASAGREKKGGPPPRTEIEEEAKRTYNLTIRKKGRAWANPPRTLKGGGDWLIGRHVRVFWDMENRWFVGIVTFYDGRPDAEDSHGATGPVHDVYYEDGSYWENLTTAQWQYDTNEGNAGVAVDVPGMTKRKPAAKLALVKSENGEASSPKPSLSSPKPLLSPAASKVQLLRGVKQDSKPDGSLKELEYEVVYAPGKSNWTTALQKEGNFRTLLLGFIDKAFPDRSVLHPWMPDFKKNVWEWGYREHKIQEEGGRQEGGSSDCLGVNGVCIVDGKTQYRCAQASQRHRWETVGPSTSPRVHKLASSSIGVISVHMGREKHAKFLRHLGVYEEYAKGWEAYGRGERREDLEMEPSAAGVSASMYAEEHDGNGTAAVELEVKVKEEPEKAAAGAPPGTEAEDRNSESEKREEAAGGNGSTDEQQAEIGEARKEEGKADVEEGAEKSKDAEQRTAWLVSLGAEEAEAEADVNRVEKGEGEDAKETENAGGREGGKDGNSEEGEAEGEKVSESAQEGKDDGEAAEAPAERRESQAEQEQEQSKESEQPASAAGAAAEEATGAAAAAEESRGGDGSEQQEDAGVGTAMETEVSDVDARGKASDGAEERSEKRTDAMDVDGEGGEASPKAADGGDMDMA